MTKHSEYKRLKDKCWAIFSQYIRLKYSKNGLCTCVTCHKEVPLKEAQAGHFIDSRCNAVLFDERLVHPQCIRCNIFLKGNKVSYTIFMLNQGYTKEEIERFEELKHSIVKLTQEEIKEKITFYQQQIKVLEGKWQTNSDRTQ